MTEFEREYELLSELLLNEQVKDRVNDVLDKIRAEIDRLHYHPKLDFIKNDEVVSMALDIIDKYRKDGD